VQTREQIGESLRHDSLVHSVTWSPDDKYIATVDYAVHIWKKEWNWSNWPIRDNSEDSNNLLKQLLMIRVARGISLTPGIIASLQPIYDQLPASAQEWIDARISAWRH